MADVFNPIKSVTAIDINGNVIGDIITDIPTPSSYKYQLVDISSPDAGRTENMAMNKMRKGQSVRVDLEWVLPTLETASFILTTFNPEYLLVNYIDAKTGIWQDRRFYVGDRSAPLWNSANGRWTSVSFAIIQQIPDVV